MFLRLGNLQIEEVKPNEWNVLPVFECRGLLTHFVNIFNSSRRHYPLIFLQFGDIQMGEQRQFIGA